MQLNQVQFAGFAGEDARTFNLPSGKELCSFSLCYSKKAKDGGKDQSCWVRVVCTGGWVDEGKKVKKGNNVIVVGPLSVEVTEKNGSKYTNVSIFCNSMATIPASVKEPEDHFDNVPF